MGSTTILDILGSLTTFGLLLIATLQINASASESNYAYTQNYLLQRNMIVLTTMLEDDLKRVGAGANDPLGGIQTADTTSLIFRTLFPGHGVPSVVQWVFQSGIPGPYSTSPMNTKIRYLDRIVDGVVNRMDLGVTQFDLRYWNVYDPTTPVNTPCFFNSIPNTGNIGPISVTIKIESPYKRKIEYSSDTSSQYEMVWRQIRTISRNNNVQF